MIKTGLYGGTFDPVHMGHMEIAKTAVRQFSLNTLWFMPAKIPPHKQSRHIAGENHRLAMLQLALEGLDPRFEINTFELDRQTTSYSYVTLQELTAGCPDRRFYFIMGGDSLRDFSQWRHPEIISRLARLIVAPRRDSADSDMQLCAERCRDLYQAEIDFLDMPFCDISSTDIRTKLADGDPQVRQILPPGVYEYILKNRLYL